MPKQVDTIIRGPQAYALSREIFARMEDAGVWPTPLNYELFLHAKAYPTGPLAHELDRLLADRIPLSDDISDRLAAEHLPRLRLTEEIRDAGAVLNRELSSVAAAIAQAHKTQHDYGEALADASQTIADAPGGDALNSLVGTLTEATNKAMVETSALERQLEVSNREIRQLRKNLEDVRRDAMTDALTGLANRKAFDERLAAACADSEPMCLALLDVDHFKRFNDTWGHQTGDQVLRFVASILTRSCQDTRLATRFGGEEFAIIFPGEKALAVQAALETIRSEVSSRVLRRRSTNDDLGAVTLSAGFAERLPDETPAQLIERADAALYTSKRGGRNRTSMAPALTKAA